ncbi:hypothetical protein CDG76_20980 [Nostoc sp. 'Peltigera membranacea cyanobiont' 210A]|uniref:hypothetical protein n=1 Tax=Nostoc sp. 'Peltigera membranacea cyanobiont' 210A TaxID=2014529 RepID=UPI000B9F13CA|nr:hypothetical protein [Nostoc sp. 'Peltigera membranacea cyanobiont' 210A]OYD93168.1 hypothetical protein CDG76_20980 [Nostoc sp. 'Peltigera membranacea cyanobiont' 210A]
MWLEKSDRQISTVRSLSSFSMFSAPLWFFKKSDRLQNLHRAIAPSVPLCSLRLEWFVKKSDRQQNLHGAIAPLPLYKVKKRSPNLLRSLSSSFEPLCEIKSDRQQNLHGAIANQNMI